MHPPQSLRRKSYKKVNLTKYYNVIVVCVQSVYIFVYIGPEADCTGVQYCTGLVPASGSGAPQLRLRWSGPALTVQSGQALQREKIHHPPVISVVVLLLLLLLFFLLPPPITKKC